MKRLIVNADDFGLSPGVNRGIIQCHEHGIVTSTSLMVRHAAAAEAAAYARAHPRLSVGLHVDLGEWAYRDGGWEPLYEVVPPSDADAATAEVARQVSAFRRLVGRDPTHLDSHQHVHRDEPAASALRATATALGVPLRHVTPGVRYCGDFYGQDRYGRAHPEWVSAEVLVRILQGAGEGTTELCCHPGYAETATSPYAREREWEVVALCDARVRSAAAAAAIVLASFADVP